MVTKKTVKKSPKKTSNVIKDTEKKVKSAAKKLVDTPVIETAKTYFKSAETKAKKINLEKFLTDAIYMLLHPVKYFTSIKADGNYENAIVKVLMYGLLTAGINIILILQVLLFWVLYFQLF